MDEEFVTWDAAEVRDVLAQYLFMHDTLLDVLRTREWLMEEVAEYANEDESNDVMIELAYVLDKVLNAYEAEHLEE